MKFLTSVEETIRKRYSCRTFSNQPLYDVTKNQLTEFLQTSHTNPIEGESRFKLLELPGLILKERKKLGTYAYYNFIQTYS